MSDNRQRKPGRPRIIESPEEMDRLVEEYVAKCQELGEPLTLNIERFYNRRRLHSYLNYVSPVAYELKNVA